MRHAAWTIFRSRIWIVTTLGATLVMSLIPLIWRRRFYFQDDTENGAYGVWYRLGQSLLNGEVPILDPSVWSAGNFTAEGQWGTWNPVIMLIGIVTFLSNNAVLSTTAIKIFFLLISSLGCYLLARSFKVHPALAMVAGIAVPLNGFTVYFDAPSWVTGAITWAILPLFWFELRKITDGGRTPLWCFAYGYVIVTVGYVAGTVAVGFVLLSVGVEILVRKRWREALKVAALGISLVLVSIVVFLPGVLTASVTFRDSTGISNNDFMGVEISGLVSSTISTAYPFLPSWWWSGFTGPAPAMYIAWFLPVVAFTQWRKLRSQARQLMQLYFFTALALCFVLLPSFVGPLRYPARFMPYVALVVIILSVVMLSHSVAKLPSKLALLGAVGFLGLGTYVSWAQIPEKYPQIFLAGIAAALGIVIIWLIFRGALARRIPVTPIVAVSLVILLVSVGMTVLQHRTTPASPLSISNVPADSSISKNVLKGVEGDTLVVGDPLDYPQDNSTWSRTSMANTWYLSEANVINRYQLLGYATFNSRLCFRYLGGTCPDLLEALFRPLPGTSLTLVDALSIDNIQILKKTFEQKQVPMPSNGMVRRDNPVPIMEVPDGWRQVSDDGEIALWSRDQKLPPAGGPVSQSQGLAIGDVQVSDRTVEFTVNDVPSGGGQVIISRLQWPGYSISNGSFASPTDGFLMTVDVPSDSVGKRVTISYSPPGWNVGVVLWLFGAGGILVWAIVYVFVQLKERKSTKIAAGMQ